MSRALVLSGGGPVGIAWETGLIAGLAEGGVDLSSADFIVLAFAVAVPNPFARVHSRLHRAPALRQPRRVQGHHDTPPPSSSLAAGPSHVNSLSTLPVAVPAAGRAVSAVRASSWPRL